LFYSKGICLDENTFCPVVNEMLMVRVTVTVWRFPCGIYRQENSIFAGTKT
jgi:hypothetical protein